MENKEIDNKDTENKVENSENPQNPKRIYNLKLDRVSKKKLKFKTINKPVELPESVDLRSMFTRVYDQGELGSCTANALCSVFEFETLDEKVDVGFKPSRLFVYYNERKLEGNINEDSGATLSTGIKSLIKYGVCSEGLCPYKIENFTRRPSVRAYNDAKQHKVVVATNIDQDIATMKASLYNKNPFVVGIAVYESFESQEVAKTGIIPMPKQGEKMLGGHAICICGYNETHWIAKNSWGPNWGDKGYFYLPLIYLVDSNLSTDLWNISKIE